MGLAFGSPFAPGLAQVSPPQAGVIGGDVGLAATTDTLVQTSAVLGVGTWAITFDSEIVVTAAAATEAMVYVQAGTATVAFSGPTAADGETPPIATSPVSLGFDCLAVVSVAGTLQFRAFANAAATVKAASTINGGKPVTGYTAVRVA